MVGASWAAMLLVWATPALAQSEPQPEAAPAVANGETEPAEDKGRFAVDVTVYGWLAGTTGEFTPFTGAPTLAFDNSFGEVLEDLDLAFFASAHARKDSFVALLDVSYASLSREGLVPPGIPAAGKLTQLSVTAAAGVRAVDDPARALDLLAGARLWSLDGSVEVPLAGISASPEKSFVDPIVAARLVTEVAPRLSALAYLDIGGIGIGSDFTYQLVGTLNYRLGPSFFVSAGYRHLKLDYSDNGTVFEGSMTGPIFGLTKRF